MLRARAATSLGALAPALAPVFALALALATATLFVPGTARAGEPPLGAPRGKVEWKKEWPGFSPWEGVAALGGTAASFVIERRVPEPTSPRTEFEVPLLDPGARYLLRGRSKRVQDAFGNYSDIGFRMLAFFPYVFDVGVIALGVHRSPDVAAQMALIDLQALTLAGMTQIVVARVVARARPYVQDCDDEGQTISRTCGGTVDNKSFYSGHGTAAFTSAGLVCVHHQHIPLYGGGPVEDWACAWAVGVAAATGLFRVVSDAHYASDVLVGAGVGWLYGYVMPRFMHYRSGRLAESTGRRAWFLPTVAPSHDGGIVTLSGVF